MIKNNRQQTLNLLGLARRARQIVSGEATVLKAIQTKTAQFVFLAQDAGPSTSKKFVDKCRFYQIPVDQSYTKQELSQAIGQSRTVIGITQSGFARKFEELRIMN